jgi:hypothetical protein
VPRGRLAQLLARIHSWLVGGPAFFSSFPPPVNSALVRSAGFTIEREEVVTIEEPEGPAAFQWILARS